MGCVKVIIDDEPLSAKNVVITFLIVDSSNNNDSVGNVEFSAIKFLIGACVTVALVMSFIA